jgi:3-oxoacyl-[acyl-carrier-protein] synthase II
MSTSPNTDTKRVVISALASLSPLGVSGSAIESLLEAECAPHTLLGGDASFPLVTLSSACEEVVARLLSEKERYQKVDRVTQLAVATACETLIRYQASSPVPEVAPIECVSIGSSRGATISLEATHAQHLGNGDRSVPTYTSPMTTAGNISSWVAQEAIDQSIAGQGYTSSSGDTSGSSIVALNTSMTCSSAFHSLLVALGFLRGGMAAAALFGGAESCLTSYTLQQLRALKIYSQAGSSAWPCKPLAAGEIAPLANTVVLGEGAGSAVLHFYDGISRPGDLELCGVGWQMEAIPSATGVSADGAAFEGAMRRATRGASGIDAVIAHAPGSVRGDEAELAAIARVFGGDIPVLSTKHVTGHTYGASGMVSLQLAAYLLGGGQWPGFPYPVRVPTLQAGAGVPRRILINTAGFGGNVISVVVALA